MAKTYLLGNSLSPMMFRRKHKKDQEEKEQLSRSLDTLLSIDDDKVGVLSKEGWPEVASLRRAAPVVMCILPPFSTDLVCSALLSAGATPLVTDDPQDVEKDLKNCRAVVVDVSARHDLIEAMLKCFALRDELCVVLAATQVGSNDRKKQLAMRLIDECGPSLVTGRLGDIYALGQVVSEKGCDSDGDGDESPTSPVAVAPQISIDRSPKDLRKVSEPHILPSQRRAKWRQHSPRVSPRASPRASPHGSPLASPHGSPKHSLVSSAINASTSPRASPCGVKKKIGGKRKIGRTPTLLPRVTMKGQFQDSSMLEINVDDALHYGQALAAYTRAVVHLYETSVITNGETIVEITNNQHGMRHLHSLLPCSAAIAAACVSSVSAETDDNEDVMLHQFSHGLAFWYVAAEEAGNHANQKDSVLPGTLRQALIDALHYLDEPHVRSKAQLKEHIVGKAED